MKIAFIHPDLGIGGAERLVIDAAVGLQARGHEVTIYTSHFDPNHCFDEARDGTLKVVTGGNTIIPPNLCGRFSILCAILRQIHLTFQIIASGEGASFDAFVVDQLSACIPFIRHGLNGRILFYCHHPDLLLSKRDSLIKKVYRIPFDWFETYTTSLSDLIVVNSKYTRTIFHETFKRIMTVQDPEVVYPCVDVNTDQKPVDTRITQLFGSYKVILSINRFERTKNIDLALESFSLLKNESNFSELKLVISGGYDNRVIENVQYLAELMKKCEDLKLSCHKLIINDDNDLITELNTKLSSTSVIFIPSIPNAAKNSLLKIATLLTYTPSFEHFGIVPLEAMMWETPVLAINNGGPLETVIEGETGWLRPEDAHTWAEIIKLVAFEIKLEKLREMGQYARKQVETLFSKQKMASDLETKLNRALVIDRVSIKWFNRLLSLIPVLLFMAVFFILFSNPAK
ncbi:putative asparagine-linked glycosylation protein [Nadsonia fulvescens var. elongata DSM 6958]|uniref:Alpha-1,3/1,6-mannosyltransferase ALG2 n=1 Tax=Nadsonia fulvescens var. elongata DSM 6958 TaxID=857566 RepID=A0A1E3PSU5_9ASCO|nr:putative asparagine-linked glycosylation protein [Nadsonia fulvescens var. elongata DSM 6958]